VSKKLNMKKSRSKYQANHWKIWLSIITSDTTFSTGVFIIFMLWAGLDLTQISVAIAAWTVASSLGQIPSGVFADRYGFKTAMFWGSVIFLAGLASLVYAGSFYWILGGTALMGFGSAMKQGPDYALLYEGLKADKKTAEYKKTAGKIDFYVNIFIVPATILGGFLYAYNQRWPFYVEIVLLTIAILTIATMREPAIKRRREKVFDQLKHSLKTALTKPKFSKIFIFSAIIGSIALLTIQYTQPLFKDLGINEAYFGILGAAMFVLRGLGSWYSDRLGKLFTVDKYLVLHAAVFGLFLVLIQRIDATILALIFFGVFYFLRGLYSPTITTYINDHITSDVRASVLSINSQILTLCTTVFLLLTGFLADHYGLKQAFFAISLISMSALIAYVVSLRKVQAE